jgi:hypothetical protein
VLLLHTYLEFISPGQPHPVLLAGILKQIFSAAVAQVFSVHLTRSAPSRPTRGGPQADLQCGCCTGIIEFISPGQPHPALLAGVLKQIFSAAVAQVFRVHFALSAPSRPIPPSSPGSSSRSLVRLLHRYLKFISPSQPHPALLAGVLKQIFSTAVAQVPVPVHCAFVAQVFTEWVQLSLPKFTICEDL